MPSEDAEQDLQDAYVGRLTRIVLGDPGKLDLRTANELVALGVIEDQSDPPEMWPEEAELRSGLIATNLGPLVRYTKSDGSRGVSRIVDLVCSDRVQVRRCAVEYLEMCAAAAQPRLNKRTIEALRRDRDSLLGAGGNWRTTAVRLVDVLEDDWSLNLAGVRQCALLDLGDLWPEYFDAVLSPSVATVNACAPGVLCPSLHREFLDTRCAAWRDAGTPLDTVLGEYYDACGHLPLASPYALSSILEGRPEREQIDQLWDTLWSWADTMATPMARYHACQVYLAMPEAIPHSAKPSFVREVVCLVGIREHVTECEGTFEEAWRLAHTLARFFCNRLEVRIPAAHGEAVAAMAWWLATRVIAVTRSEAKAANELQQQIWRIKGIAAAGIREIVHPVMSPSSIRFCTTHGPSIWALATLAQLDDERVSEAMRSHMTHEQREELGKRVVALAVQGGPLAAASAGDGFMFTRSLVGGCESVLSLCDDESGRESREAASQLLVQLREGGTGQGEFAHLATKEATAQTWLCHAINIGSHLDAIDPDVLWGKLKDREWREQLWPALPPTAITLLGNALIELAARKRPKWVFDLPHLFAEAAERLSGDEERRQVCIGLALNASCALRAGSAVRRLLGGQYSHLFRAPVDSFRANAAALLPHAGQWAGGHIRGLLADLTF